jgi:PPK2 family polyphosphate:nucleotide phosphotransferase
MDLNVEQFRVKPGARIRLEDFDPAAAKGFSKAERQEIERLQLIDEEQHLRDLHERLFAEGRQALLIILLAMDTGGKDSTVDRIFSGINPQGCQVVSFRAPTEEELDHDFLWRIHYRVPRKGRIGIFNRSHYEDVTVVRVLGLIDNDELQRRLGHIRDFENLLVESGTAVLKFHLRISKEEQAKRLRERLENPAKHWKFDPSDLKARAQWNEYQTAFEDAINATSTDTAPWYIIPANSKWYRDAIVTRVIVDRLQQMNPQYPPPVPGIEQYVVE